LWSEGRGKCAHELSILIRIGDGGRAGCAPSNVSTTNIRPPQHGHRRGGEALSASLSGSARAWRALDVAGSKRAG
jgi:hypothetical protein